MHPGFIAWWRAGSSASGDQSQPSVSSCGGARSGCKTGHGGWFASHGRHGEFGIRRPLRYMAWHLDLTEEQISRLAVILDELRTERAQGEVDDRRARSAFAEVLEAVSFDEAKVKEAAQIRVRSAEQLRDAVVRALRRTHELLTPEQRTKLAHMLRTGSLTI